MTHMSRKLRPLAALAMVALISAGCGSNAPSETATASNSGTASSSGTGGNKKLTARDKAVKFAECIRAHGVSDFPDPNAKNQFEYGVSVTLAVWKRATTACKDLQPPGTLSARRTPKQQSASLRFAQCVRDNGVKDFPDPTPDGALIDTSRMPGNPGARSIPGLDAAMLKCREHAANAGVVGAR